MVHQLAKPWRSDFEMVNPCGSQWCSNHAKVSLNFPWVSCAHGSIAFCCSFSCFRTAVHQGMLVDRVEWLQPFMIAKSWRGVVIPDSQKWPCWPSGVKSCQTNNDLKILGCQTNVFCWTCLNTTQQKVLEGRCLDPPSRSVYRWWASRQHHAQHSNREEDPLSYLEWHDEWR